MSKLAIFFALVVLPLSGFASGSAPFMDIFNYRDELIQLKGKTDQRCPMNLRIRPALRNTVLKDHRDYDWLLGSQNYSSLQKRQDDQWVKSFQDSMSKARHEIEAQLSISKPSESPWGSDQNLYRLATFKYYPGFYSLADFASWQIGSPNIHWSRDRGFTFKVFFEFKNPQKDLTPDLYREFSKRLAETDFEGDSKIPLIPGWIRFTWNNVIVHASTMKSAILAEKIGLEIFGTRLRSYSRGVDVRDKVNPSQSIDWPHFLCSGNPSDLPEDVFQFVHNQ